MAFPITPPENMQSENRPLPVASLIPRQGTPCCQEVPAEKHLANTSRSIESPSLQSRKAEAMETSPHPMQQIKELDEQYNTHMRAYRTSITHTRQFKKENMEHELSQLKHSRRGVKEQHRQKRLQKELDEINQLKQQCDKQINEFMMNYCKPDLAEHLPLYTLMLLQQSLSSEHSVLSPPLRWLIDILDSPKEMIKIIKNNPDLAQGTLINMDEVAFKSNLQIPRSTIYIPENPEMECGSSSAFCDYANMSFRKATFPHMRIMADFKNCDFSGADFTGSTRSGRNFNEADLTGAPLEDSYSVQQIEELNRQYRAHINLGPPSLSREQCVKRNQLEKEMGEYSSAQPDQQFSKAELREQLDVINHQEQAQMSPWHKKHHLILMVYHHSELVELIPADILQSLQNRLISEHSLLDLPRRLLIKILDSPEEMKKVIKNNPDLARGDLVNMDGVAFNNGAKINRGNLSTVGYSRKEKCKDVAYTCDYSGISFKEATFPCMKITEATFSQCHFSEANFTGSEFLDCDFSRSDLTAACFAECSIKRCNFHEATLTDIDVRDIKKISYLLTGTKDYSEWVAPLSHAILEYGKKNNDHRSALPMRLLAGMLLTNRLPKESEEVCDELVQQNHAEITDLQLIGDTYLDEINTLSDEAHEYKAQLAKKTVTWLQKGWQTISDDQTYEVDHETLCSTAMSAMCHTDSTYNWRDVLEEIKSKRVIKNSSGLMSMAQLLVAKQEDNEAMAILKRMTTHPEHCDKKLPEICKAISTIGLRNKALSAEACHLLETTIACIENDCITGPFRLNNLMEYDKIFACWLYRIDLRLQSGRSAEALELISAMNRAVDGAEKMLLEEKYEDTFAWKRRGSCYIFRDLVLRIRAAIAAIKLKDGSQVHHDLKNLKSN